MDPRRRCPRVMELRPVAFPPYAGDQENLDRFRAWGTPFFHLAPDPPLQVVLGCGTPVEPDVILTACTADQVPVVRRKGGGGAVVLGPGVLVVTGCFPPVAGRFPESWLDSLTALLAEKLAASLRPTRPESGPGLPLDFVMRGKGDLCIFRPGVNEIRKVLGSSLYLARDVVLYQGSLLVSADLSLLPRYLGPPSLQPEYRQGRSHLDFVTNLPEGWRLDVETLATALNREAPALGHPAHLPQP